MAKHNTSLGHLLSCGAEFDGGGTVVILCALIGAGLCLVIVLALGFNCLLCLVFYKRPLLVNPSNSFVINLAVCQLGNSVLVLPLSLVAIIGQGWVPPDNWCLSQGFLFTVFFATTMLTLAMVSMDRNYAITNSLRYPYVFTQTRCNLMIGASWILGVSLGLPPLFGPVLYHYQTAQFRCGICWNNDREHRVYLSVFVTIGYAVPMLVTVWCYCSILKAAINHSRLAVKIHPSIPNDSVSGISDIASRVSARRNKSHGSVSSTLRYRRLDCKATRTILVILTAYFTCWVPYFIVCMSHFLGHNMDDSFETIAVLLVYSTTAVNPVVYGFMNRAIRGELLKFIGHVFCKNDADRSGSDESHSMTTTTTSSGRKSRRPTNIWIITSKHKQRLNLKTSVILTPGMDAISEESHSTIHHM